jgi:hypothetical protein
MKVLLCVWMAACVVIAAEASHQQKEIGSSNGLARIIHDFAGEKRKGALKD